MATPSNLFCSKQLFSFAFTYPYIAQTSSQIHCCYLKFGPYLSEILQIVPPQNNAILLLKILKKQNKEKIDP